MDNYKIISYIVLNVFPLIGMPEWDKWICIALIIAEITVCIILQNLMVWVVAGMAIVAILSKKSKYFKCIYSITYIVNSLLAVYFSIHCIVILMLGTASSLWMY